MPLKFSFPLDAARYAAKRSACMSGVQSESIAISLQKTLHLTRDG